MQSGAFWGLNLRFKRQSHEPSFVRDFMFSLTDRERKKSVGKYMYTWLGQRGFKQRFYPCSIGRREELGMREGKGFI